MSTPIIRARHKRMTVAISVRLQDALKVKGCTVSDLVALSGLARPTIYRWVHEARAAGLLWRSRWEEDNRGRLVTPVFSWGSALDIAKPRQAVAPRDRMRATRIRRRSKL